MFRDKLRALAEENLGIEPPEPVPKSVVYIQTPELAPKPEPRATVRVVNEDTAMVAYELDNPLVLNFASHKRPGGGWLNGSMAQEEALFYRSLYHRTLTHNLYPLKGPVYSPRVPFVRDRDFCLLKEPRYLACLAVAALHFRERPAKYTSEERREMGAKIRAVFAIAHENKHENLVLGALGCGVFRNPTREVAELFRECVDKYAGHFKQIVFAILDAQGDTIRTFRDVFESNDALLSMGPR